MKYVSAGEFRMLALAGAIGWVSSCASAPDHPDLGPGTFHVVIQSVNGNATLPTAGNPMAPNLGNTSDDWAFTIEARTPTGNLDTSFKGYVRLTVAPGTVVGVNGDTTTRNVLMANGTASGVVQLTGVYGPAHLWVEDLGYVPAAQNTTPKCSDGIDNNSNGLIDFPADPGCYYADDDTEDGGTYSSGVSPAVEYALPKISDVRGKARTPFSNEAIQIATAEPEYLVVTRVSGNGFFVTDVNPTEMAKGYNSLFSYNFSTPANMQVCDRVVQLSGTTTDFYGFTQLSFPSYLTSYTVLGADGGAYNPKDGIPGCKVPEPILLDPTQPLPFSGDKNTTSAALYPYEASLVRLKGFTIASKFGAGVVDPKTMNITKGNSNCDFNGNGQIDYTTVDGQQGPEGICSNTCDNDPDCSEYTAYSARGQYKVSHGTCGVYDACAPLVGSAACTAQTAPCTWDSTTTTCNGGTLCGQFNKQSDCASAHCSWTLSAATMILINTSTVSTFDPVHNAGNPIDVVTGSLTEFSGGTLNWTVEARCADDLVCPASMGCAVQDIVPTYKACVLVRTIDDPDQGTN
jgi:hypothetical protein